MPDTLKVVLVTIGLILCILFYGVTAHCQIPDNPQPQSDGTVCIGANSCGWHQLKELPPMPKSHNWFYRHPLLTVAIPMVIGGGIYALTKQWGCPSHINGFAYDGTPPCPTQCYAIGNCEWGTKQVFIRRRVFLKP
jgi:hypothetical protein